MFEWMPVLGGEIKESLLIQLAIIILAVKAAGVLSRKLKQPAVFGKLLVGIVIGPSFFNLLTTTPVIQAMAEIGVILLMFLAGLETDLKKFRETGTASVLSAMGGVALPLAGGIWLGLVFGFSFKVAIFIGITLTATSVSISAETLREMGRLQSKEGMTILGAAVLDDIIGIIILSVFLGVAAGAESDDLVFLVIKILVFLLGTWLVGRRVVPAIFRAAKGMGVREGLVPLGMVLCLVLAYLAEVGGLASITGAYLAGLLIKSGGFSPIIYDKVESISYSLFMPVFLINIGLSTSVAELGGSLFFAVALVLLAVASKAAGGALGAKLAGFSVSSSVAVGAGLVSRGEIALIVAALGMNKGIIDGNMFVALVIMVLITTVSTPLLLKCALNK
jgi:Kef-type K+ transport system membrane component KefB